LAEDPDEFSAGEGKNSAFKGIRITLIITKSGVRGKKGGVFCRKIEGTSCCTKLNRGGGMYLCLSLGKSRFFKRSLSNEREMEKGTSNEGWLT